MTDEKYCFEVGEEGQQGLGTIDHLFNPTTQSFLTQAGLQAGMKVLDIGCGLGTMSVWLAEQVGPEGSVIAIDNNEHQTKATEKQAKLHNLSNLKTQCLSAYNLDSIQEQFDFIYCRFILHHLNRPSDVIRSAHQCLKKVVSSLLRKA